jgi:branched-chain amino acid transport system substrate-binding protein
MTVAYSKQISLTQLDFTSECSAMKAANVTTVDIVADPSTLQRLGQSCSRQGFNPIYVQSQATVSATSQSAPGLGDLRVVLAAFPFCCLSGPPASNHAYQRYVTAYQRYGGSAAPGPAATDGYSAALLFQRFVDEVAKTSPAVTPASLLKAAGGIKNETLGGLAPPITLSVGKKTPDSRCWFVAVARNAGPYQVPDGLKTMCRR